VHYTLKEIYEQPTTITRAGINSKSELERLMLMLEGSSNIYITGSGTSYNAALVGKYLLSRYAGIKVEAIIASEAQFSPMHLDGSSLLLALSQSGESADVLEAASIAKEHGSTVASIVNVPTSSLARLSAVSVGLNCGVEVGVAATKSFTSQLAILYQIKDTLCGGTGIDFESISKQISTILSESSSIQNLAQRIKDASDIYVLGNGLHYFVASEASLKIKELSYIHAEALPSGELKHGPLALLDSSSYVLAINPSDSTYKSTLASVHEVKARGAKIIGVSDRPSEMYDYWIQIPTVEDLLFTLVEIVPLQLLAYYTALARNADPDYPRNLAKSVTVK
jgi:glucosamine--fructose-6-phosphate aminotransferase (isomerizing)